MIMEDFMEMFRIAKDDDAPSHSLSTDDAIHALKAAADTFLAPHNFKAGDLIQQKDGLSSDLRVGERGKLPAVFIRYQDLSDLYEKARPGAPYTISVNDCLVGWINNDGGVVISASCSEAYEAYQP